MKDRQESLMRHQRRSENESLARVSYEAQWVHYDYDQELSLVLHICTPWVASTMKRECDFAISDEAARIYTFKEKPPGNSVEVTRGEQRYAFSKMWLATASPHVACMPEVENFSYTKTTRPVHDYDATTVLDPRQKYSISRNLLNRIAQEMSDLPTAQFGAEMAFWTATYEDYEQAALAPNLPHD
ncbi:hypothetical protein PI124_g4028 [Phytophthora idaei]|nr:hypothetical protein PI124_g4028 [Phytophthora idaei]